MPLGELRSGINGTLNDFVFPDTDNLPRRNRRATMAHQNQNQNANPVPVAAAAQVETWTENPAQGTFNPGTKEGASIFKLKSKSDLEKKLELVKASASEFRRALQAKESTFGGIVSRVPIEFDHTGNTTKFANMIS